MSTVRENNLFLHMNVDRHIWRVQLSKIYVHQIIRHIWIPYISFFLSITTEIFKWPVFDVSPCIYMVQRVHVTNDTETQPSKRLRVVFHTSGKKGRRETILRYRLYYVSWFQDFYPRFCFTISSDTRAFHLLYGCSPHTFADFMPPFLPKSLYRM